MHLNIQTDLCELDCKFENDSRKNLHWHQNCYQESVVLESSAMPGGLGDNCCRQTVRVVCLVWIDSTRLFVDARRADLLPALSGLSVSDVPAQRWGRVPLRRKFFSNSHQGACKTSIP